jgi:D-threo-aldose 1-dehydrogenase
MEARRLARLSAHLNPSSRKPSPSACASTVSSLSSSSRQLGARSGITSTALGLGGVCWGEDDVAWMENVHASIQQLGITYYDTAPAYGNGLSEHRMGMALRSYPRDSFVLSTKVGYYLRPDTTGTSAGAKGNSAMATPMPFLMEFDYGYHAIIRQYEDSLQRLGAARVDCLVIHGVDYSATTVEGVDAHLDALEAGGIRALMELRDAGKIGAVGLGVNEECPVIREHGGGSAEDAAAWNYRFVERVTAMGGGLAIDFLLLAGIHTLLNQTAHSSGILQLCLDRGVGVVMGGPLNSGILTDDAASRDFEGVTYSYKPAPPDMIEKARQLASLAAEFNVSLTAAALQFPLGFAAMSVVIPGGASPAEVAENKAAMDEEIPQAFWEALRSEERGGLLPPGCPCP